MWIKTIFVALCATVSMSAMAEAGWVHITESDDTKYSVKSGSLDKAVMNDGAVIYYATGRTISNSRVTVNIWSVPARDCIAQSGELTIRSMKAVKLFTADFVFGAGSISSGIAEAMCTAAAALK